MAFVPAFVGLDYHSETIRVCVMTQDADVLVNRNVRNCPAAVIDLVRSQNVFVQGVAIEACCGAADFAARLAEATEWDVRMAHPAYVQKLKQGRDKTDCGDAALLADLLRVNYLPEVWLADETTRQLRRLVRYRQGLVEERKAVKLRLRSLLREERVECETSRAWTKAWFAWLDTIRLGEQSRWVLDQDRRRLARLDEAIAEVDVRMETATADDPVVQKLRQQAGVGLVTALVLRAAVGRFDRFRNGKQLAKYCGLTPCNASSGKRQADAGLIDEGNPELRAVLIQLAKRLPRHVDRWRELHVRLRRTKPANVASAAIANRWVRQLHHLMVERRDPSDSQAA
jgi:transposase